MKKLLITSIFAIAILTLYGCGVTKVDSKTITKALKIENQTSDQLYIRANNWMVDVFHNAEDVIQFSDKKGGIVSGRYYLGEVAATLALTVESINLKSIFATIKIRVKDGASKITITSESYGYNEVSNTGLLSPEKIKAKIDDLIYSFELAMNKSEDNNW